MIIFYGRMRGLGDGVEWGLNKLRDRVYKLSRCF